MPQDAARGAGGFGPEDARSRPLVLQFWTNIGCVGMAHRAGSCYDAPGLFKASDKSTKSDTSQRC